MKSIESLDATKHCHLGIPMESKCRETLHDGAAAETFLPSFDGNGNISAWSDPGGALLVRSDYSPFGQVVARYRLGPPGDTRPDRLSFGFSTKYTDAESGLLYYGYRYLDPVAGRWLSRDPIGENGGVNLYGFVGNGGGDLVDVLGLSDFWINRAKEECEVILFFGHAQNLGGNPRNIYNTVSLALQQHKSMRANNQKGSQCYGLACNAGKYNFNFKNSSFPHITSNIGVNPNVEDTYNQGGRKGASSPDDLVDPSSEFANNQIDGRSQNASPDDFEEDYFDDLSKDSQRLAQQSVGFARIFQKSIDVVMKEACRACKCDEVTVRLECLASEGRLNRRLKYLQHLKPEIKKEFEGENGIISNPLGCGQNRKIKCKKFEP